MSSPWDGPWLRRAKRAPSPFQDERSKGASVDLLVLHAISLPPEAFGSGEVPRFFQGKLDFSAHPYYERLRELRVSAHFFLERDGQIWQHVPVDRRAWHAGISAWQGRERCNDFSVGIEIEGSETQPFAEAQYLALQSLIPDLWRYFPLLDRRAITGHSDIAPGRKWDPGPHFDWPRLWQGLS